MATNSDNPLVLLPPVRTVQAWMSDLPPFSAGLQGTLRQPWNDRELLCSGRIEIRYSGGSRETEVVLSFSLGAELRALMALPTNESRVIEREWLDGSGLLECSRDQTDGELRSEWLFVRRSGDGRMTALSLAEQLTQRELPPGTLLPGEVLSRLLGAARRGEHELSYPCLYMLDRTHAARAVSTIAPYEGNLVSDPELAWTITTRHVAVDGDELPEAKECAVVRHDGIVLTWSTDSPDVTETFQMVAPRVYR